MKRRNFITTSVAGTLGIAGLYSFDKNPIHFQKNIKITITPWSLMRTGYGGDDPLGIDVFDYPAVAKSLGFDYIDHEMFHFPPNINETHLQKMIIINAERAWPDYNLRLIGRYFTLYELL